MVIDFSSDGDLDVVETVVIRVVITVVHQTIGRFDAEIGFVGDCPCTITIVDGAGYQQLVQYLLRYVAKADHQLIHQLIGLITACSVAIKVIKANHIRPRLTATRIIDGEINLAIGIGLHGLGYAARVFDQKLSIRLSDRVHFHANRTVDHFLGNTLTRISRIHVLVVLLFYGNRRTQSEVGTGVVRRNDLNVARRGNLI
ncbi:Uncharacterised protein [Vibrio cholerae]|uniref:Uncharacterized protein n=1 Tax=Vibrio cholerae TaxID=666 RepID=A0A655VCM1_VIBCL|nr:Uncharacterised protein [Vibrio cholerae]